MSTATRSLNRWAQERREQHLARCRPFVVERAATGQPVSATELDELFARGPGLNGYEFYLLVPLFDDELLLQRIEHALANSSFPHPCPPGSLPAHYDESLMRVYLPMVVDRLRQHLGR